MPHILVIDDDDLCRDYLSTLLRRRGHQVTALPNGTGLANAVEGLAVDAVITDLYMPQVDGIETINRLKVLAPGLPVIGVTGMFVDGYDPCIRAMKIFGAIDVITKPIEEQILLNLLDRALAQRAEADRIPG